MSNTTLPPTSIDTEVDERQLGLSVLIYGVLGLTLVTIFAVLRKHCRTVYSPRKFHVSREELPPAELPKSLWRWLPPLLNKNCDDLILSKVGLDSYVTIRFLHLGIKCFAIFLLLGFVFLIPIYYTQGNPGNLSNASSSLARITMQHVAGGDSAPFMWMSCLFVYMYTTIGLYLLHREYLLIVPLTRDFKLARENSGYTILVERIPREIFSSKALIRYFESIFPGEVMRVDLVPMNSTAKDLAKVVDDRNEVVSRLERAMLEEYYHNEKPHHDGLSDEGSFSGELTGNKNEDHEWKKTKVIFPENLSWMGLRGFCYGRLCSCFGKTVNSIEYYEGQLKELNSKVTLLKSRLRSEIMDGKNAEYAFHRDTEEEEKRDEDQETLQSNWSFSVEKADEVEYLLQRHPFDEHEEVERSAAFVTFKSKTASTAAGKTIVSAEDEHFLARIAPEPRDVNWERLGCNPRKIMGSRIGVLIFNLILLILFGVLTSTISATTNLEAIREGWGGLDKFLQDNPWAIMVFDQIAPLLLIIAFALVPPILNLILTLRFEVSESTKENSFFLNYSAFLVIQMFLFYQLSGAILSVLSQTWQNPREFITVIALAITRQSTFYMQFICIRALWVLPTELFRLGDLMVAFLVTPIVCGRKRTPREKRNDKCGCRDLTFAGDAWLGLMQAQFVLIFCIGITYSVFAPLSCLFAFVYYCIAVVVYRNQFLYVYVKRFESGGSNWSNLAMMYLFAFGLFQVSMLGIFAISGAGAQSGLMAIPFICTCGYACYLQSYFESSLAYISLSDARGFDVQNLVKHTTPEPLDYRAPVLTEPDEVAPKDTTTMLAELNQLKNVDIFSRSSDSDATLVDSGSFQPLGMDLEEQTNSNQGNAPNRSTDSIVQG